MAPTDVYCIRGRFCLPVYRAKELAGTCLGRIQSAPLLLGIYSNTGSEHTFVDTDSDDGRIYSYNFLHAGVDIPAVLNADIEVVSAGIAPEAFDLTLGSEPEGNLVHGALEHYDLTFEDSSDEMTRDDIGDDQGVPGTNHPPSIQIADTIAVNGNEQKNAKGSWVALPQIATTTTVDCSIVRQLDFDSIVVIPELQEARHSEDEAGVEPAPMQPVDHHTYVG